MSYVPQPGTIPARAIAWLQAQPFGGAYATPVLAEILQTDTATLHNCLQPALRHGAVISDKRDGRVHWRLGDGKRPVPPADDEDDAPVVQRIVRAVAAASRPAPASDLLASPPEPAPAPRPAAAPPEPPPRPAMPQVVPTVTNDAMRCALWSDGTLVIQCRGQNIELDADDTRALVRYLERLSATEP